MLQALERDLDGVEAAVNDSIPLPDESGALHELLGGVRDLLREATTG
ncbi:MAG: hypothetical protein ACRD0W_08160 [Acidimicrobiales bacterium]